MRTLRCRDRHPALIGSYRGHRIRAGPAPALAINRINGTTTVLVPNGGRRVRRTITTAAGDLVTVLAGGMPCRAPVQVGASELPRLCEEGLVDLDGRTHVSGQCGWPR